jgi:hypothetical protein
MESNRSKTFQWLAKTCKITASRQWALSSTEKPTRTYFLRVHHQWDGSSWRVLTRHKNVLNSLSKFAHIDCELQYQILRSPQYVIITLRATACCYTNCLAAYTPIVRWTHRRSRYRVSRCHLSDHESSKQRVRPIAFNRSFSRAFDQSWLPEPRFRSPRPHRRNESDKAPSVRTCVRREDGANIHASQ